jgi:adenylate cyclase
MAAGVACSDCGMKLRTDAKFCDECGSAVSQADKPAEFKQVTVLFADVVHSMDIAAAVGAERLRELMSELLDRFSVVVQRYGGTVNQFTGDGIMAVFGAPMALEDHASRACLAALDIQKEAQELAADVQRRDGIDLRLRVGLNSGEVIAGEVGSRGHSYTTVGDQVGMAQRMESVASPGGVTLSESTARLVENVAELGEPQQVRIKGADVPVRTRTLLSMRARRGPMASRVSTLVGREWELTALTAMLDRSINGHGCVAGVVGPPGIGKSRLVAEIAALAEARGVEVFSTYCESHTSDVPFLTATRLLRSGFGIEGMDDEAARTHVHTQIPGPDSADLVLLLDELGIRDPDDELPEMAPEARRRRLTALVNAATLARPIPAIYVVEDAHWIDATSEALLADFLAVVPQTKSLVLITYRPEYDGALSRAAGAQTIALAPLDDAQAARLVSEMLGTDSSVAELTRRIAERASGNPFFAQEIVRDLAGRGVLAGERGAHTCADEGADVDVPATLQAAIAARIDRLEANAKLTLNAAAVIGMRFDETLLEALADDPALESLIRAELIDQVAFTPRAEYAFRHPLIRAVAHGSQLKSARAQLHRRLVAALEARDPGSTEENAALIAEHLEAAGDLSEAFGWHMRAGTWLTFRDVKAARQSWQRATQVADQMRAGSPGREAMRIAPRALLCASSFRMTGAIDESGFEELYRLAGGADEKPSLALAMTGHVVALTFHGRYDESSRLATELTGLIEATGDPELTVTLLGQAAFAKLATGEIAEAQRLTERVIDLAAGDPHMGRLLIESPLAHAVMTRAAARMCLGTSGWRHDLEQAAAECREFLPIGQAFMFLWKYAFGIVAGAVLPDAAAVSETAEILEIAEQLSEDQTLEIARFLHGFVLAKRGGPDRGRGWSLLADARAAATEHRSVIVFVPLIDVELGREKARTGDLDEAIELLTSVAENEFAVGGLGVYGYAADVLVESLLQRGESADIEAAQAEIERLVGVHTDAGFVWNEIFTIRLRALLSRANGDEANYRLFADRYRSMAIELDYAGHIAKAEAMMSDT